MLTPTTVRRIEELLAAGELSQRQIAALVGVDRETVSRIARGLRPDYEARRRAKEGEFQWVDQPERCGKCGKLSHFVPCYACWLEGKFDAHVDEHPQCAEDLVNPIGVELKPDQQERYRQILNSKIRTGVHPVSNLALLNQALFEGEVPITEADKIRYARWFLGRAAELSPLFDLPELLQIADTVVQQWDVWKWAGDELVQVMMDVPSRENLGGTSLASLEKEAQTRGIDWRRLLDVLPPVVRIIRLIRVDGLAGKYVP